jgi:DNA-directed RNA polymerase subunit RPC12/RpoP
MDAKSMSKNKKVSLCNSVIAMILTIIALISCALMLLTIIENDPEHTDASYGFAMFAFMFGVPGLWLCIRGRKQKKHDTLHQQLSGYFKSHDSFSVLEMAQKIGKSEMETEQLIFHLIEDKSLDVVFHRRSRKYFHTNRLEQKFQQINRCPSCGANLKKEIAFDDEIISCQYCGHQI